MPAHKKIRKNLQKQRKEKTGKRREELVRLRREPVVKKLDKPSNLPRAKSLGYKAKQGFVVARARVRRGSGRHSRPKSGRRPKRMGFKKLTRAKSKQVIAEEKTQKKFPNLEVLNSYLFTQDGNYKWFEVIMIDPSHPAIQSDESVSWITSGKHRKRANRGLTSAGRKASGKR